MLCDIGVYIFCVNLNLGYDSIFLLLVNREAGYVTMYTFITKKGTNFELGTEQFFDYFIFVLIPFMRPYIIRQNSFLWWNCHHVKYFRSVNSQEIIVFLRYPFLRTKYLCQMLPIFWDRSSNQNVGISRHCTIFLATIERWTIFSPIANTDPELNVAISTKINSFC